MNAEERLALTVESGIGCVVFSDFHAYAERLLGHPVWTHEFGDDETWLEMKVALAARQEGVRYRHVRTESPLESLQRMLGPKPIFVVDPNEPGAMERLKRAIEGMEVDP